MNSSHDDESHLSSECTFTFSTDLNPNSAQDDSISKRKECNVDITGTFTKISESELLTEEEDEVTAGNLVGNSGTEEDLYLLADIHSYYLEHESYPFADVEKLKDFYENWVKKRAGEIYRDCVQLNVKMQKLYTRFWFNNEKKSNGENVEALMNELEKEIYYDSNVIWGDKDDQDLSSKDSSSKDQNEELTLLADIQDFRLECGSYPFADVDNLKHFYKGWIKQRAGTIYRDCVELNQKMKKLHSRFLLNMERKTKGENVEALMDELEKEVFHDSNIIWGKQR